MDKTEIKKQVHELLVTGTNKTSVFARLSGQGIKDAKLAHMIASHADARRGDAHGGKVKVIVVMMVLQALLGMVWGFTIGAQIGPNAKWIVAGLITLIPLLLAWGFYDHRAWAYNAYIALTLSQLPRGFAGLASDPMTTLAFLAVNLALLAFVWYVRTKIFPDFGFMNARKVQGKYVFAD